LNLAHQGEVESLKLQIENQSNEIGNLGLILEASTNQLSVSESQLELKAQELADTQQRLLALEEGLSGSQLNFDNQVSDLIQQNQKTLDSKNLEFQKLLSENANLIGEIEHVQLEFESKESELGLLRVELEELKAVSFGKADEYKEILANKNFEITNLEAGKAALSEELAHAKMEILNLENQLQHAKQHAEMVEELSAQVQQLSQERDAFHAELDVVNEQVKGFVETIRDLNDKIAFYDDELAKMRAKEATEEQEAFIDRLFKQIDGLNDERLVLLEEKEQMANQLLKMNDVISNISQHVDAEHINVQDLNNHRKNVILATNSNDQEERSQMKEQINDLVREIDKCIALLSA
jgi:chromosome segregation ATPase